MTQKASPTNINTFLDDVAIEEDIESVTNTDTITTQDDTLSELKSKFISIVQSMEVMEEERNNMKELYADINTQFDINPKSAKRVARWMHSPEKFSEDESAAWDAEQLFKKLSN